MNLGDLFRVALMRCSNCGHCCRMGPYTPPPGYLRMPRTCSEDCSIRLFVSLTRTALRLERYAP